MIVSFAFNAIRTELSSFLILDPLRSCKDYLNRNHTENGIFFLDVDERENFLVFCDMTLAGGGWTVIQRRVNGNLSFNRNWTAYKNGFGTLSGNLWLGLEYLHRIVSSQLHELYVGLESFNPDIPPAFAKYRSFDVASESEQYRIRVGGYDCSSPGGDSLTYHNDTKFSTPDHDNDDTPVHCAEELQSGWWFKSCYNSLLNGVYSDDGTISSSASYPSLKLGVVWRRWLPNTSLKEVVMAVRPVS